MFNYQALGRILICNARVFKGYSRTKIKIFKELYPDIHSACVNNRKPKIPKMRYFLVYQEFSCMIFFKLSFGYFLKSFFVLFAAVDKINSKQPQISRSLINFQGKFLFSRCFKCR